MSDDPSQLRRLRELFDRVVDLPEQERKAVLDALPDLDDDTRQRVLAMAADDERTGARWSLSPIAAGGTDDDPLVGQRLGAYDIVRRIGLGGMGAVYEAVRADDQFKMRVAIKLVQSGLNSTLTLARFRRERQILANLQHKNIATLLDGGVSPDGRPFLVMEYVEGQPITTWCDQRALSVRQRIALFRQVCDAVRHAHNNLVVHRDLKPGNIMVADDGSVKLLDFGVAKLVGDDDAGEELPLTRGGARAFTPEYASPEQIRGDALTTASDVYSLGVVLYELLAGCRPHAGVRGSVAALERAVLEAEITRPSVAGSDEAARCRGELDAERLRRRLAGELDSITLRALDRAPERRYRSVEALADDLKCWLEGRTVDAQRGWAGYRARKFVQRYRAAIAAGVLVTLSLVAGVITTSIQARRALQAQARAERVNGFLSDLLASVRPATGGRDVPVSELLDAAAKRVGTELKSEPVAAGDLEAVIGGSYVSLGRYDDAEPHLRAALRLRERVYGRRSNEYISALDNMANLWLIRSDLQPADSLFRAALALRRQMSSRPDTLLATLLDNMGSVAHSMGRPAESERYRREALAIRMAIVGPHDDYVAVATNNLAVALAEQNRWAEAESLHRAAVTILKANHPEPSTMVADAENALATALDFEGKSAPAESLYEEVLALRGKLLGREHPDYAFTLMNYSIFLVDHGKYARAAELSREVLALRGRTLPDTHPAVATSMQTLGRCLDHMGQEAEAGRMLQGSLDLRTRNLGPDHWLVASSMSVLGEHYGHVRQFERGEALMRSADVLLLRATGEKDKRRIANLKRMEALYVAWDQPARASALRAMIATAGS